MVALDWTIDFRDLILAVFWVAAGVLALAFILILQVTWMRLRADAEQRRLTRFREAWEPLLGGPARAVEALPPVAEREHLLLMTIWNEACEELPRSAGEPGAMRGYLLGIARRLGMGEWARDSLRARDSVSQLVAIGTAGHLGETALAGQVESLARSPDPLISLAAARALLHIDGRVAGRFVTMLVEREDWSRTKLETIVEQERAILAGPLVTGVREWTPPRPCPLISYLRFLEPARALPAAREILGAAADEESAIAALKALAAIGTPADAELAAGLAGDESWRVRVQVANVLGRIGGREHAAILATLIQDTQWWVRYRAAQALARLMGEADLRELLEREPDRYAGDMLRRVLAEQATAREGAGVR